MNEAPSREVCPLSRRVLLVDDEERLRGILARYLSARGHEVLEAGNAAEARDVLVCTLVDVVLLDINLPDETGWDVLRWLTTRSGVAAVDRPRVVIVSAVPPSAKRIEQFAPDAVLNKPFPIDALARIVEADSRQAEMS